MESEAKLKKRLANLHKMLASMTEEGDELNSIVDEIDEIDDYIARNYPPRYDDEEEGY